MSAVRFGYYYECSSFFTNTHISEEDSKWLDDHNFHLDNYSEPGKEFFSIGKERDNFVSLQEDMSEMYVSPHLELRPISYEDEEQLKRILGSTDLRVKFGFLRIW